MKILFICMYMSGRHGSVLHILEYARFFKSMNANISIGTVFIEPEIRDIAAKEGFNIYRINNVPLHVEYDIVYSLHLFLFPYLLLILQLHFYRLSFIMTCFSDELVFATPYHPFQLVAYTYYDMEDTGS